MFFRAGEQIGNLASERLHLRPPGRRDASALHDAIMETLDELSLWLPWARPDHRWLDTRYYLKSARLARARRHAFEYVVVEVGAGRLLGIVSLHRVDWFRRSAGLGYWVRRSAWGKGFATEAARTALDFGFHSLGLHRVEAHVALDNVASQRVVEKCGLRREGVARGIEFVNGRPLDHIQYAVLRSDVMGMLA